MQDKEEILAGLYVVHVLEDEVLAKTHADVFEELVGPLPTV